MSSSPIPCSLETVRQRIDAEKPKTVPDFVRLRRSLQKVSAGLPSGMRGGRVALLSVFTTRALDDCFFVKACEAGLWLDFYVGPDYQMAQEILNPQSGLFQFQPDLTILFIDLAAMFGETFFAPYQLDQEGRKRLLDEKFAELQATLEALRKTGGKILVHNLCVPSYSPMGIAEGKQPFGWIEMVREFNAKLQRAYLQDQMIWIFDYDGFCSIQGKGRIQDPKMYYRGDVKLSWEHFPSLCEAYLAFVKPLFNVVRKCLVLDLDNTLWGGILGEDGLEQLRLGPTPEGRSYWEFQKEIRALFDRGILLAINSRNDLSAVLKVLREHPHMILREEHFAAIQANWEDKASNIRVIAKTLNIGTDSLVFLDDDPFNRALVRRELPEVLTVELPADSCLYPDCLRRLTDFNSFVITEEDRLRGRMMAEDRRRDEFKQSATDFEKYLQGLKMCAVFQRADEFTIPRISQLTLRTNQFNLATRRYQTETLSSLATREDWWIASMQASDLFGDYGVVGVAMVEKNGARWRLENFLMSCRVLGRGLERALLAFVMEQATAAGARELIGEYLPTAKNGMAATFYKSHGFQWLEKTDNAERWIYTLANPLTYPAHIQIKK